MRNLLILLVCLVTVFTAGAQPIQPNGKRFYRQGDYVKVTDAAGNNPETYASAVVKVITFKALIIRVIIDNASDYYLPSQFLDQNGTPYGTTAQAAVDAWALTSPASGTVISGTGVAGVSSINGKTGAITTVVETTGSYTDPTFISSLNAAKITETTAKRFVSDSKINQWDGYGTSKMSYNDSTVFVRKLPNTRLFTLSEASTLAGHTSQISSVSTTATNAGSVASAAQSTANTALTAAGSVTATVATHTTQINSVSATAASASTNASAALSGATSATSTANTALNTANTALTAANSATGALGTKAPLANPAFSGVPTAPTAVTNTATDQIATMLAIKNELVRWFRDSLTTYGPAFDPAQFIRVDSAGLSFIRIKPGIVTSGGSSTTATIPGSATTSPGSGTTATTGSALSFYNAEVATPITLVAGPPRYYQGTAGVDWASGGNTGIGTTRLPDVTDGWVSQQYVGTDGILAAVGFDSLYSIQSSGRPAIRAGVYVYNGKVGIVKDGAEILTNQVPAIGSYIRIRRSISGGVATYRAEYSPDGTTWTDITPAPTAPATKFFTLSTTGILYVRTAIVSDFKLYNPTGSSTFVTY